MTFDDDYIQLRLRHGTVRVTCQELGIEWPPPEYIEITGAPFSTPQFRRLRYSAITDGQRQEMTRVCRGAEYVRNGPDLKPNDRLNGGRRPSV